MQMNPVFRAERRYQEYVIRTNRSSTFAITLAVMFLIPALIMSVVAAVSVGVLGADLPPVPVMGQIETLSDTLYTIGTMALVTMNVAHYLVVALISSGLAIVSVQREHRNRTWDLLVLTRVSARQIAFGKIGASLWVLRRDLAIVTLLRVGLVGFALDFVRPAYPGAAHTAGQFAVLTVMVVAWTFLDMALAVATAAASALMPRGRSALMPLALGARAVTTFGGIVWISRVIHQINAEPFGAQYAITGLTGIAVFALLAAISLKIAEISAQFAHASPRKISQPISQVEPRTPVHGTTHIPNLSQG
jgi:ABC-type transport system involved in multi-copper enzyme maturation permease subunit